MQWSERGERRLQYGHACNCAAVGTRLRCRTSIAAAAAVSCSAAPSSTARCCRSAAAADFAASAELVRTNFEDGGCVGHAGRGRGGGGV